ncbi:MAG: dual specificity protein phosphatase family protein [Kiritimatiellae bacterium]|nr:dual specificity protein phosphatase family protein [Kiritimatiellia bacterium]
MGKSAELIIESRGAHFAAGRVKRPFKSGMLLRAFGALFFLCAAHGCVFSDGSPEMDPRPEKWAKPVECAGVPNLYKINDSLYRSAQPTAEGMTNLVSLGIKTVVNLRDFHSDEDEIGSLPLKMKRIEVFTANMKDEYVDEFLSVVADTNATPVLVHCQHGADRTGTMCAMYRIMCEGWNVEDAIDEMQNGGFGYHSIWLNLPRFIRRSAKSRGK